MAVQWKPVRDYEDLYQVSDRGRVRRIVGGRGTRAGRILRPNKGTYGYPKVELCRDGRSRTQRVHTLVAEAFLGPRPAGQEVNHKNRIRDDNRLTNLEYLTPSENRRYSYDVLGVGRGEDNSQAKLTAADVRKIRRVHAKGGVTQRALAKQYGISDGQMSQILHRKKWAHVA